MKKLIYDVFEIDVSPLNRLGHDPSIVAFGWWHDGELVANVSLYERRLWLSGERVEAYGVQSVAVRPEWRGKGLFRDLMVRALDHADARAGLVILSTDTPDLYTRFGFRAVRESFFSGSLPPGRPRPNCRRLSLENEADVALLLDLFARRVPTSLLAAACDHPALFMLKAVETPEIALMHLPELDAVVAVRDIDQAPMNLLDIVAPSIPSLEDIAAALGYGERHIHVYMTPDRLAWTPGEIAPVDTGYMVRGPYPPEGEAFMLSDMRI
ncbi:GNAT family N-acetyltransferase [Rhizobiaceae bacterium BDR2-2]|uniref:GNAT family N-acetyltransferase n=1 Tax=Ectorhizobium quercum TaxID=2965071 RepID=A0AAE3MX43_9HYPH|nr:GNAT family N-acetyltransferase [Ectorhizobium quercum]MCX8996613.1 GNAT family N-acetyltransferase [Ectorhizobium quercum]